MVLAAGVADAYASGFVDDVGADAPFVLFDVSWCGFGQCVIGLVWGVGLNRAVGADVVVVVAPFVEECL